MSSPQNLLIPPAHRSSRVAIDWGGFCTLLPVGFDLGQLLIGLAHAGELDVSELPALQDAVLEAFCSGLAAEDFDVPPMRSGSASSAPWSVDPDSGRCRSIRRTRLPRHSPISNSPHGSN